MLTPEALGEFKEIYRKKYGVELPDKEATKKAINLLNFYKAALMDENVSKNEAKHSTTAKKLQEI